MCAPCQSHSLTIGAAAIHRRALADTLADTLAYERDLGLYRVREAGLSPAAERRLLAQWSSARTSGL